MFGNFKKRISTDRFGNNYQLCSLRQVLTKDGQELPVYSGVVEIQGRAYKFEVSNSNKTGMRKGVEVAKKWLKITQLRNQNSNRNF